MSGKQPHYAVQFAQRYRSSTADYLNAWTALIRLDELIADARALKDHLDTAIPEEKRWAPWVGAEIVSYYVVGFVTCLEWHARSRLVDLLTFKPTAARSEDLRNVKDKIVIEMLASNVTIASLVGAATNISSFEEYIGVFSRLLLSFNDQMDGFKAIKSERVGMGEPWVEEYEIEELKRIYSFRNDLVHEIGIDRIGHINVRERWNPTAAIQMGELVRRTMQALEAAVLANVPSGFPNVLGADGFPASEWQRLEKELPVLEAKIGRMTTAFTDQEVDADENWATAKAAAANYLAKEKLFLDEASMLLNRYVELREPLKLALIKSRHDYLKSIVETVGDVWELDEVPEGTLSGGPT